MAVVLSIDPGITNLAIWVGTWNAEQKVPVTLMLDKINIRSISNALYDSAIDVITGVLSQWTIDYVIIETQEPHAIPTRIVATAIYGFVKGMGLDVRYSGSVSKNKMISLLSQRYNIELAEKADKDQISDPKIRRRKNHDVNKINAEVVVVRMLKEIGDMKTLSIVLNATDTRGKKKSDDLCDAILLGIGSLL
jgi:hypothetical protein